MPIHLAAILIGLSGCTGAAIAPVESESIAPLWNYSDAAAELRALSCPAGTVFKRAQDMTITATQIDRGSASAQQENLTGVSLADAWHLTSDNDEFGGLSGLDILRSGSMLAVTDDGKFVWIGMDPETGSPDGIGSIAYMRDENGDIFPSKRSGDAEDLVYRDGLAIVSFEQDHRIAAYDLETCGAAAHAAPVTKLNKVIDRHTLKNNRGTEAIAFVDDALKVGFETHFSGGSPVGLVRVDGTLDQRQQTAQPPLFLMTGMDVADGLTAMVFRAYDPIRGARAIVQVQRDKETIAQATLRSPLPVDNFEAIAIGKSPSGKPRIWLISDDNFDEDQRTLLLALDLTL